MSGRISGHIRGNVVGYVAVFIALSGTAAALPGKNSVDSGDIKNGQVKTKDVADGAITNPKLAPDAVEGSKVAGNSLGGTDIDEASLDPAVLQARVTGDCPVGESIRQIAQNGGVTCQAGGGTPSGNAGGDLTGTYPNPTIGSDAVGTNEVDGSLTGADFADDNSLGGAEISESTLFNDNSLNDADIDQGSLGLAAGGTKFDFTSITTGTNQFTFSNVPSRYQVRYTCPNPTTNDGQVTFGNLSAGPMDLFFDDGNSNPAYMSVASGVGPNFSAAAGGEELRFSYRITTPTVQYGIVTVNSVHLPGNSCYVQSQGWLSG